ncbi:MULTISPECIES: nucleotidyltransferase family protein [Rufibacter]|uniref:D-glycero-alpha-D-manno-heptose 1-phosphate guanylyltransferase n=1 Tax=Rufibacter quisquiliarum TaxID=1549639 RepID=A0A839GWI9_9BACT|nr:MULTISPECIES: nucleotidyltransferase family protein [Rufibacter]MBA9079237.1 D-glycero-alpha-D-manno-heptose 1-phosphate guanylyltransferase [Rufibacter quisquiliarum]
MTKEAIVLAGGLGTRLRSVVQDVPKPMAEVAGRPFLDYLLFTLAKNNIKKAVLAVGHKHEVIQEYYAGQNPFGVALEYSIETELLGTGGAISQAAGLVQADDFFILNGDTYFEVDLAALHAFAQGKNADLALSLKQMKDSDRYGSVVTAPDQRVTSFKEKQPGQKQDLLINGGVYYMKKHLLQSFSLPQKFSFEVDLLQPFLPQIKVYGQTYRGTFIDIGIPEDYQRAQQLLEHVIL